MNKDHSLGNGIFCKNNIWTFDSIDPQKFTDHMEMSIPLYRQGHELILSYLDHFLAPGGRFYDLGCSNGELLSTVSDRFLGAIETIGVDNQKTMIEDCIRRNQPLKPNMTFELSDISSLDLKSADAIVSYYTLQFLKKEDRAECIHKIYSALKPGGAFLFFEKIIARDGFHQDLDANAYHKFKKKNGYTADEILSKGQSLNAVLRPQTSQENVKQLTDCSFKSVEVIFRYLFFEGYICIK